MSTSSYEGRTCPLARFGKDRDGKGDRPVIAYGLLCDGEGRPVSVSVCEGNTGDPSTVGDQVDALLKRFGLERAVLVGERGMLTGVQIDDLREHPGLGWISALKTVDIRKLLLQGTLQMSLFDERDLCEIYSAVLPGERLVACFNPALAEERGRKREDLLRSTEKALGRIAREVARRTKTPLTGEQIALKVGAAKNQDLPRTGGPGTPWPRPAPRLRPATRRSRGRPGTAWRCTPSSP